MIVVMTVQVDQQTAKQLWLDQLPDQCPICHHAIEPVQLTVNFIGRFETGGELEIAYRCPRVACAHFFIARFRPGDPVHGAPPGQTFRLRERLPLQFKAPDVPEEIVEVSPSFQKIYSQALAAESYSLDEIAGVGLRKALEFLIREFCARQHPEDRDEIVNSPLAACIEKYVDDANVKKCAHRATWLGNDAAHYVRKWEDKDLSDLKTLIQLTLGWVRNSILTEKYLADMHPGK